MNSDQENITITLSEEDVPLEGYDKYLIVLRGFYFNYDHSQSFEKLKVRIYWKGAESSIIEAPTDNELIAHLSVESHDNNNCNLSYIVKYTVIGLNTAHASYGESRMDNWLIKSLDGNTKEKAVSVDMHGLTDNVVSIATVSGFTIESYDGDNNTFGEVAHDIIQLGFHISDWSVSGNTASVQYTATGNLNTSKMGAAFKFDTTVFAVSQDYAAKLSVTTGNASEYHPEHLSTDTKSETVTCDDSHNNWTCTEEAN